MKIKLIIPILIMLFMTSCAPVVSTPADEVRLNRWAAGLTNGSYVSLVFNNDNASFKIQSGDKDARLTLNGLCVIDDKRIFIYNKSDGEPYVFDYIINNNKLRLKYQDKSLILTRKN